MGPLAITGVAVAVLVVGALLTGWIIAERQVADSRAAIPADAERFAAARRQEVARFNDFTPLKRALVVSYDVEVVEAPPGGTCPGPGEAGKSGRALVRAKTFFGIDAWVYSATCGSISLVEGW